MKDIGASRYTSQFTSNHLAFNLNNFHNSLFSGLLSASSAPKRTGGLREILDAFPSPWETFEKISNCTELDISLPHPGNDCLGHRLAREEKDDQV